MEAQKCEGIKRGEGMNIYDIAAEAGTSISTVSRVLNNKGNVNPKIRDRVEAVLKKYDYKPSAIARGMVSKTMKNIAILTVDVRVTHYARMIYVIEQEFSNLGYNVSVCNTGGSIQECDRYFEILSEKQTDGIVLIGSVFNELINYPEITAKIKDTPVVIANGQVKLPNFYSVLVDDTKAIRMASDYMFDHGRMDLFYVFDIATDSGRAKLILESFDTYRKAVKKQLERQMKDKAYKEREGALRPGFMLWDINGDGYRDVVVTDQVQSPGRVVLTAVWDPAEEELVPASEADLDGPEKSYLSYNQDSQSVWLTIAKDSGERDCFQMEDNGFRFESVWHFELEYDDWGDPLYYVNGLKCDLEEWTLALAQADQEAGSPVTEGLLPLDPETVKQAVDCSPGEELPLWQP